MAEDNPLNQKVLSRMLENIGIKNMRIVSNGVEALNEVQERKYDIILMDVMMPMMGGIESTQKIRGCNITHQPLIIGLTADAFRENIDKYVTIYPI